jgi:hypothetical protein
MLEIGSQPKKLITLLFSLFHEKPVCQLFMKGIKPISFFRENKTQFRFFVSLHSHPKEIQNQIHSSFSMTFRIVTEMKFTIEVSL